MSNIKVIELETEGEAKALVEAMNKKFDGEFSSCFEKNVGHVVYMNNDNYLTLECKSFAEGFLEAINWIDSLIEE